MHCMPDSGPERQSRLGERVLNQDDARTIVRDSYTPLGWYWGVLTPDLRTLRPKRRPGAQNGAQPQPGLFQSCGNVGYKSACLALEAATGFCAL